MTRPDDRPPEKHIHTGGYLHWNSKGWFFPNLVYDVDLCQANVQVVDDVPTLQHQYENLENQYLPQVQRN